MDSKPYTSHDSTHTLIYTNITGVNDSTRCDIRHILIHIRRCRVPIITLKPRQNGRNFADDTFKRIFLNGNVCISIEMSLKFVPRCPINNIQVLFQIMAWCRPGDKPLSEAMGVRLPTHICVTRPHSINLRPSGRVLTLLIVFIKKPKKVDECFKMVHADNTQQDTRRFTLVMSRSKRTQLKLIIEKKPTSDSVQINWTSPGDTQMRK